MRRLSKYIVVGFVLMTATIFQSCSDFLNKDPYSTIKLDNFYQNDNQANLALAGIYSVLGSDYTYGYYLSCRFTSGTDAMVFSRNYNSWNVPLFTVNNSTKEVEDTYRTLYEGINLANVFIEKISTSTTISESSKARFLSEARFLRGFFYFDLVRWFGEVPMRTKPVLSGSTQETTMAKAKVLDIYKDVIIPDLEYTVANGLTKNDTNYEVGRITKSAALGTLQRVYLTIAGVKNDAKRGEYADFTKDACYQKAIDYGMQVVNNKKYSLLSDYKQVFLNEIKGDLSDEEVIFEVQFENLRAGGVNEHGRIGNMNGVQVSLSGLTDPYAYAYNYAGLSLTYDYAKSTGDANEDKRFIWNVAPFRVGLNNVLDTIFVTNPDTNEPVLDVNGEKQIEKVIYTTERTEGFSFIGNNYTRNPGKFRRVSFDEMEDGVLRMERKKVEEPSGKSKTLYVCYKMMPNDTYNTGDDGTGYMYMLDAMGNKVRLSTHNYMSIEGSVWKQIPNGSLPMKKLESGAIDKNFTGINFPVLRYADVLLMIAEAHIQKNQLAEAIPFVNQIRQRAGVPNLDPAVTGDQTSFFNEIVDERNRELCFEGVRRHDLIRWGLYKTKLDELNELMVNEPINKNQQWLLRSGENYQEELEILPTPQKETNINIGIKPAS
ncbi:RagB/SusD family nutrient uptake outer membrane protein [Halosquirtibacter xylanolyticus]|uniref:RagB/SusD family nutrient uptake outer membrane protein n=1 Tax=Halosquirtibacter xylanolyticus TaxID=3374599 RepID=UPI003748F6EC|nr:RagB/SusD family nutrient uptake outer membrane protein [Prolixibacteraceae bacterium]